MGASEKSAVRGLLCWLAFAGAGCGETSAPPAPPATSAPMPGLPGADRNAFAPADDPLGDKAGKVVYLEQNWAPSDSQRFYFTSQGSQILPYDWAVALEQPDKDEAFFEDKNVLKFRYLPQRPDAMNPDGFPVGFVKDLGSGRAWLGLTCAACHTGEIHYNGVAYRVDGAPALGDIVGLLRSMSAALKATRDTPEKFDRFAKAILTSRDGPLARDALRAQITEMIARRDGYNARNFPAGDGAGYGRIDAFGAILNEVFHKAVPAKDLKSPTDNAASANAPVSIPFLWDTPQHDKLQWNGSAQNGGPGNVGALARNVGEVLGVFGDFQIPDVPGPFGYASTVKVQSLNRLEEWLTTLWSPQWPADFPAIDQTKRDLGKALFERECRKCHADIDRADPKRTVKAVMWGSGTDALMANNFAGRVGRAGKLEGSYEFFVPLAGQKIPASAPGALMLHNAVVGTIVGSPFPPPEDDLSKIDLDASSKPMAPMATTGERGPRYKARPLNGIWATAPYLHNGSVPSLADLLRPAKDRPKSFSVGSRVFDPAAVGFRQDAPGVFTFRTVDAAGAPISGNSNAGHEYGTGLSDDEKGQLLEYLKSL
jgi:mono/diheme cytochrome c family protein